MQNAKGKMQRAKGKMQNERARRRNSALLKAYKTTVCRRRFSFCKIFLIFLKNFYFSGRAKKNDVILWKCKDPGKPFGMLPEALLLLSCFAKKVTQRTRKGENSRAHRNRVPAKPALWERGETANKAKLLAKSKNEQKGEA